MMIPPANTWYGSFASRLDHVLRMFVDAQNLGEVFAAQSGFMLQTEPQPLIRAPDVAFVNKNRIPAPDKREGFWHVAPDLVVEIVSLAEPAQSIQDKVQDYLAAGTQLIWVVYPKTKSVMEYQADGKIRGLMVHETLEGGKVLPGFQYSLQHLFR